MIFTEQDSESIKAYAGTYSKEIFSTMRNKATILQDLNMKVGVKNHLNLTKLSVKRGIMKHRRQFDAANDDLRFSGRRLSVNLLKRDFLIDPYEFRQTWMSELMNPGVDNRDIPFVEFITNSISKELASEINNYSYLAVDDGGEGLIIEKSVDGLGTHIARELKAGNLTAAATGAITDTNAVSKFDMMAGEVPSAELEDTTQPVYLYCSPPSWKKYQRDNLERYGKYTGPKEEQFEIHGSCGQILIKPCTWMGNSQRIIASRKENLVVGVDGLGDMDKMSVFCKHELIEWRFNFVLGFQIQDLDAIKVNDQA